MWLEDQKGGEGQEKRVVTQEKTQNAGQSARGGS